ncbi:MAG: RDD family protein [Elusimicrobia bacterium]|nr:RDD family protein [Elusimicrobiota bacterium]
MPEPNAFEPTQAQLYPAKISDRFLAYFLDLLPFLGGFGASVFFAVLKAPVPPAPETYRNLGLLWAGLLALYQFAGNLAGGTPGKKLMGLRVVRRDGAALGWGRSLARALGYLASTPLCNFGFLVALVHPESRALHDLLSGALVVEARARSLSEAFMLFAASAGAIVALFLGNLYFTLHQPTPADYLAIDKARAGLRILAGIEEACKARNGAYTKDLSELAEASGDVEEFKKAMGDIFEPDRFRLETGVGRYRISAAARDRRKTRVRIEGP